MGLEVPDWNAFDVLISRSAKSHLSSLSRLPNEHRLHTWCVESDFSKVLAAVNSSFPFQSSFTLCPTKGQSAARIMASVLRRRRAIATDTPSDSPTPRDESPEDDEKVRTARRHKKSRKRKTTAIFLLGSLFGIVVAGFFANSNDLISLPDIGELSMDSLLDVLPAGLVKDMRDLVVSCRPPGRRREKRRWCTPG